VARPKASRQQQAANKRCITPQRLQGVVIKNFFKKDDKNSQKHSLQNETQKYHKTGKKLKF